ncbi:MULTISPECIES: hypothetical protein [unclassified Mesorhizobium]|uniref:hypothetical protein n=1 Tax=unclassified Mesorhizobium TaxID=325217 RepID=UPI000FC9D9F5|nr:MULTISPECIES: hypothetical protein [unclassified Mesorhizobium]RUV55409.1 hypothetical protein EOA85_21585 [Mesorhizobium sp. M5C.F.Ca.IN.020.29.1.1]RWB04830.1 MAG: hypothetical protein EOQ33_07685 [Mesorhizobium sp.]RWC23109.1 MAG: hypothetical protein EOS51_08560 [Mesorhizobium sp.]RWD85483.1 MAG: hypothetical protein EOS48_05220 [Mesorhizobium sp.]RWE53196.1 MAG: hypothetical protein EOS67_28080 [Mesorhizobium sp.]
MNTVTPGDFATKGESSRFKIDVKESYVETLRKQHQGDVEDLRSGLSPMEVARRTQETRSGPASRLFGISADCQRKQPAAPSGTAGSIVEREQLIG